jgi:biofilm PGA synthesis N-glycosyltransferase PgaC
MWCVVKKEMSKAIIIIPAYNEASCIAACITCAKNQSYHADVVVVCDNCTDNTAEIARSIGVDVFETVGNKNRKAGALNQALDKYLHEYEYVLIQDADTIIASDLLEIAIRELDKDPKAGAVCSKAGVKDIIPATWIEEMWWRFQRIEYGIFDSSRIETLGTIKVLHGMATVYRVRILEEVKKKWNRIYDENNITEDYELTVCIKEFGWRVTACLEMHAWTDVPLSFSELWTQRVRWFRGGVDVLRTHGLNRITVYEFLQHAMFLVLTTLNVVIMYALGYLLISGGSLSIHPLFWLVIGVTTLDGLYRLRYVENLHAKEIALRLAVIPFSLYQQIYQAEQLWAYCLSLKKSNQRW